MSLDARFSPFGPRSAGSPNHKPGCRSLKMRIAGLVSLCIDKARIFCSSYTGRRRRAEPRPPAPCIGRRIMSIAWEMKVRWHCREWPTTGSGKLTRLPLYEEILRPFAFALRRCATPLPYPRIGRDACKGTPTRRDRVPQFGPVRSFPGPSTLNPQPSTDL